MQTEETQMQEAMKKAQEQAQSVETEETSAHEHEVAQDNAQTETETKEFDANALIEENEALKAKLADLEASSKSKIDSLVRAVAETENQKKRIEADVERERKYGNEKILKALIPVVDSLELALIHSNAEDPAVKPVYEGVQNTVTLLLKELGNFGVKAVDPLNQEFDPNLHQAISMAPSAEVPANHVLNVMQKGYTLNERVVRPAMVIVSTGAPAGAAAASSGEEKNSINIEAQS